ncbi:MAG: long-chain acyl-CoA synthetase [Thermonema sp.]|uniref:AMP-dependent synthetase/ligase n=1 Tax=Thermonema sp. TaxID=2231181 RepID=UPI0021DC2BD4|nr:AMP-binding protein [Thermonema sp.]GIV39261.1 MAG: long-chain acyl-CoA synthetase [Thermonema sp.]
MKEVSQAGSSVPHFIEGIKPKETLLDKFYRWERECPDRVYLRQPYGQKWKEMTFAEVGKEARRMAAYFASLDLKRGDHIGLLAKNHAYWIIADLAIMMGGYVSVPIYPNISRKQLEYIIKDSDIKLLLVGKLENRKLFYDAQFAVKHILALPDSNIMGLESWEHIRGNYLPVEGYPNVDFDDLFTLIYTSGTTGHPKGVKLTYFAISICLETNRPLLELEGDCRFFSYLPLAHSAERAVVEAFSLESGGSVSFYENRDTFLYNLQNTAPTHFLAVPAVWQKFYEGIMSKMPAWRLKLLLKISLLNRLIKKKILQGLGLHKVRLVMTGAAPMPANLHRFFGELGLEIQEVYGITEMAAAVCMHRKGDVRPGTVGKPFPMVQLRIDPDSSEIIAKAPWMFIGYYRDSHKTAQAIDAEGWFHTGDRGYLTEDGHLVLEGRLSDEFKTIKGEFVNPNNIEPLFALNENIGQVCVVGEGLLQPVALVTLSEAGQKEPDIVLKVGMEVTMNRVNSELSDVEQIEKVIILPEEWTVDNGLLTPTMKLRRKAIHARYAALLPTWLKHPEKVVFVSKQELSYLYEQTE